MIKRTTAVYHILVVSILLLAHAVIPHIHFHSEIVITGLEDHTTKKECDSNQHQHDDETGTDADFCLLKQVYLARTNDNDSENDNIALLNRFKDSQGFHCTILNSADDFVFIPEVKIFYSVFYSPFHTFPGSGNINTRGSPIV